ncbi:MAG: hypothetical protein U9R79_16165 [Armatimonadota bacterium]|nr:hypothetical protein [Armatimonadota bacterium]
MTGYMELACLGVLTLMVSVSAARSEPVEIGSRLELLVDEHLIERMTGDARLRLHHPVPREVVQLRDRPWEGNSSGYTTVFQDGDIYRMYYRGSHIIYREGSIETPHRELVCYAESEDGIAWTRPELGLVEFEGSSANNIIHDGLGSHNFTPFKDTNPDCTPEAAYKALAWGRGEGTEKGLYAFRSADAIHWSLMSDDPVITTGAFDSQNLAFWDSERGEYREYHRAGRKGRDIMTGTSDDFLHWSEPRFLDYSPGRVSELYTNQVMPYYRAPHILLGFPTRYVDYAWAESTRRLPQQEYRHMVASSSRRSGTAITDGMFMTSRDRVSFRVWPESFIRPGIQRPRSWFYGDNYQAWGLVETRPTLQGAPNELSIYVSEGGRQPDGVSIRRYTLRIDGFVSVEVPLSGGELLTRPVVFEGEELIINVSTSAAGSVRVELQDELGMAIPAFALDDCPRIFGDEIERPVQWGEEANLAELAGTPVRLRFELADADLYSFRFR